MGRGLDLAWSRLPDYVRSADDGTLEGYLAAIAGELDITLGTLDIADPATSQSGTCELISPAYAPRDWLRFTGWLLGVNTNNLADADVRGVLTDLSTAQRRGSIEAIKAVTRRTLTGSRDVFVIPHPPAVGTSYTYEESGEVYESSDAYDSATHDPYHIIVVTIDGQTPDDVATLAAAMTEKPAGCTMELQVLGASALTYTALAGVYSPYDEMTGTGYSYLTLSSLTT